MTYLELVNNVLRRLREDAVTAVTDTVYSTMIGDLVNDAKRTIEESWDWTALRDDIVVPTVAATATYSLTGTGNRVSIVDVRNMTSLCFMRQQSPVWGRAQEFVTITGSPGSFIVTGVDGSGDTEVTLYPTPDDVYSVSFNVYQRTADFTNDTDATFVPSKPIILLAWAMAAREKGEVGGQTAGEIFGLAKTALADAIAYDSALNPSEIIFYEV